MSGHRIFPYRFLHGGRLKKSNCLPTNAVFKTNIPLEGNLSFCRGMIWHEGERGNRDTTQILSMTLNSNFLCSILSGCLRLYDYICAGSNKTPNHIIAVSTGTSHFVGARWGNRKCINARKYILRSLGPDLLKHVKQENMNSNPFCKVSKGTCHFVGA